MSHTFASVLAQTLGRGAHDADGILRVGIISFLLNENFLEKL